MLLQEKEIYKEENQEEKRRKKPLSLHPNGYG
jgi:hypothetical protein